MHAVYIPGAGISNKVDTNTYYTMIRIKVGESGEPWRGARGSGRRVDCVEQQVLFLCCVVLRERGCFCPRVLCGVLDEAVPIQGNRGELLIIVCAIGRLLIGVEFSMSPERSGMPKFWSAQPTLHTSDVVLRT